MTMQEVIENELKCVQRDCCRLENECAKCDLVLPKEEIINAYNKALSLETENAELKDKLKNLESVAEVRLANWQKYEKENEELRAKIEKMKVCQNCKFEDNDCIEEPCSACTRCLGNVKRKGNSDKWELQED